jgi:hypothetical protein
MKILFYALAAVGLVATGVAAERLSHPAPRPMMAPLAIGISPLPAAAVVAALADRRADVATDPNPGALDAYGNEAVPVFTTDAAPAAR